MNKIDRKPAVAGQFYTADPIELKKEVETYLKLAQKVNNSDVLAVISPHAGYIFSGKIAALSIKQIDENKDYENIFIIGLSHRKHLNGAAVYCIGDFQMPGFKAEVNINLCNELIKKCQFIEFDQYAHQYEHSIEVQLPFLHYHLKKNFKIVPILMGTGDVDKIETIANYLKPFLNEKNIFVVSTDFSHYPSFDDAQIADKTTAEAFVANDVNKFIEAMYDNEKIKNLSTSACNWASMACLLYMTQNQKKLYEYQIIDYQNSGHTPWGDKTGVVGYYAISLQKKSNNGQ